jgi:hypothetical protein
VRQQVSSEPSFPFLPSAFGPDSDTGSPPTDIWLAAGLSCT